MILTALITSLQITSIYVLFMPGCLLGGSRVLVANFLDRYFGKIISIYIQKPLWECLFCMSSFWTIVLTWSVNIRLMLCVCGINFIISKMVEDAEN